MPSHPLIAQYLSRHGIPEAARPDGRATLLIDDKYRLHLGATRLGWLAITARLCSLPPAGIVRDELFLTVGRYAAGMLTRQPSACVVDPAGEALWLQQLVRADTDDLGVDEAVGSFSKALFFWQGVLQRPASRRNS